jgi:hypothetical protein
MKNILALFLFTVLLSSTSYATTLYGPPLIQFGMKPDQIHAIYSKKYKYVGSYPKADRPKVIYQQKYMGTWLGIEGAHLSPMFYLGRLFTMSAYFPVSHDGHASQVYEKLVSQLTGLYGKPQHVSRPRKLTSSNATTAQYPVNSGDSQRYKVLDLQIETGIWIPNAEWTFSNGAFINALIHASEPDAKGMKIIMPLVVYNKHDILHWKN